MKNAIHSEWIKLRTARSNLVLAGLAIGIPLVITLLIATFGNFESSDGLDTFAATVLVPSYLCVFLSGVVGVLGIGQEYRHNTIRVTFTVEARRSRVLAAKVVVTTLFGAGIGLVSQLVGFGVAKAILSSRDVRLGFSHPGVNLTAFIGQVVLCGLFTLAGFGIGAILRQPAGAIPLLLLWPLIGEGTILQIIFALVGAEGMVKWLPFSEGLTLGLNDSNGNDMMSRLGAGLYFGAWVAVIVGLGWYLVERRDA
jgi:ABC-type transport system involved in multi-copper enzyme maturation permease subunit